MGRDISIKPLIFPITYKCNLSCKMCNVKDSKEEPDIDKCLDLIRKSKCNWVYITGGEPLLSRDLGYVCKKLKTYGKKVGITTNGAVDNYDIINDCDRIGVSIDGDKNYHDAYRGDSYDKAINFLSNIVGKVETVLMFTLFYENKHLWEKVKKTANEIGVNYLQISRGIYNGNN